MQIYREKKFLLNKIIASCEIDMICNFKRFYPHNNFLNVIKNMN